MIDLALVGTSNLRYERQVYASVAPALEAILGDADDAGGVRLLPPEEYRDQAIVAGVVVEDQLDGRRDPGGPDRAIRRTSTYEVTLPEEYLAVLGLTAAEVRDDEVPLPLALFVNTEHRILAVTPPVTIEVPEPAVDGDSEVAELATDASAGTPADE